MLLLGLVLLAATGTFTGLLIGYNSAGGPADAVTMFGHTLGTLNTLQAFLAGIALTLVFSLGLAMTAMGASTARRRRSEWRTARREAVRARAERDAMAARLESDQVHSGGTATETSDATSASGQEVAEPVSAGGAPTHRRARMPHVFGH